MFDSRGSDGFTICDVLQRTLMAQTTVYAYENRYVLFQRVLTKIHCNNSNIDDNDDDMIIIMIIIIIQKWRRICK